MFLFMLTFPKYNRAREDVKRQVPIGGTWNSKGILHGSLVRYNSLYMAKISSPVKAFKEIA